MYKIDGKTIYSIEEAAERTGKTLGQIRNLIINQKVEGFKPGDGTLGVTEKGLKQLSVITLNKPYRPNFEIISDEDRITWEKLRKIAMLQKTTNSQLILNIARKIVQKNEQPLKKLESIISEIK